MSEQAIIVPAPGSVGGGPGGGGGGEQSPLEFLLRLHRLFRGRYLLAIVLAGLGGVAGAVGGYLVSSPKYTSTRSILIRTQLQPILTETPESRQLYNPFEMARTVANYVEEQRVIDRAMSGQEWRELGREFSEQARDEFADALQVITDRDQSNWVRVQFTDRDRRASRVAVDLVMAAFVDIHKDALNIFDPKVIEELKREKQSREDRILQLEKDIRDIERSFQTNDLDRLAKTLSEELSKLNDAVRAQSDLVAAGEAAAADPSAAQAQAAPSAADELLAAAGQLATIDPVVSSRLTQYMEFEREVQARVRRGLQPLHRDMVRARADLDAARQQLEDAVNAARAKGFGMALGGPSIGGPTTAEELERAKATLARMEKARDAMREQIFKVDDSLRDIQAKRREIDAVREIVANVTSRLNVLAIEGGTESRIEIIPSVHSPARPSIDNRRKYAALGLALGGGAPLALVMLLGLIDRRVRYSDEAQDPRSRFTLLGVLPYLPNDLQDPEQAQIAAHCVHQIRTLLQIGGADHSRKVFAVTSPTSGDGKTSLSTSLGLSFAASGARTLMIDFDLIGAGLTSALGVSAPHGLLEATLQGQLGGHVRPTNFARLSIVPAGRDDAKDVSSLSLALVRNIIQQAKDQYDAVIIDTGPILGSLEASLVCAAADGTILTLGRGQQRGQAERAIEHLAGIGATFLGVVFNRADAADFKRAVSAASVRSRPLSPEERAARPMNGMLLPHMGPMARTVASQIRTPGEPPSLALPDGDPEHARAAAS